MTIAEAKQLRIVDYLASLGYHPQFHKVSARRCAKVIPFVEPVIDLERRVMIRSASAHLAITS